MKERQARMLLFLIPDCQKADAVLCGFFDFFSATT
jgi:hypothetical protein